MSTPYYSLQRPGDLAFVYYQDEAAIYNYSTGLGAIPSSPILVGYTNVPGLRASEGGKGIYAAGSPFYLATLNGARVYEVTFQLRIGGGQTAATHGFNFLQRCLRTSGVGTTLYGMPQVCLFVGVSNNFNNGFTRVIRFASCSRMVLNFNAGGAQEITADVTFIGLAEEAGSVLTPSPSALSAMQAPIAFQNLLQVNLFDSSLNGQLNMRANALNTSISLDNGLAPESIQPDAGDNVSASRIPYQLIPHNEQCTFQSTFNETNVAQNAIYNSGTPGLSGLRNYTANSTDWSNNDVAFTSNPIQLIVSNQASGITNWTSMTVSLQGARLTDFSQQSADSNTTIQGSISAIGNLLQIGT